jgi:hypothetical protein
VMGELVLEDLVLPLEVVDLLLQRAYAPHSDPGCQATAAANWSSSWPSPRSRTRFVHHFQPTARSSPPTPRSATHETSYAFPRSRFGTRRHLRTQQTW